MSFLHGSLSGTGWSFRQASLNACIFLAYCPIQRKKIAKVQATAMSPKLCHRDRRYNKSKITNAGREPTMNFGHFPKRRLHSTYSGCKDSIDPKSTRLNSSHANISYAVFCLKKKKKKHK